MKATRADSSALIANVGYDEKADCVDGDWYGFVLMRVISLFLSSLGRRPKTRNWRAECNPIAQESRARYG
jgi:hypothetical protein